MTDLRKAAEMALEALDDIHSGNLTPMAEESWNKAKEALRQALAEDALKTVADIDHSLGLFVDSPSVDAVNMSQERVDETAKDVHEPVAWISNSPTKGNGKKLHWTKSEAWKWSSNITPLYTAPPKREWVGLTDDELFGLTDEMYNFARHIEAKLKEKNT